ncbi:MFS transporter [Intestinimonas sp. HCP28S3_D6]|uniref:MFS transporter n=1 Tax=Intestinimonas sp. HCP28S3_D6 TaxID=3438942 RepID=UPI003F8A10AA
MARQKNYKKTLTACYLGFVTQAISANFAPLLFLTFRSTYGITLEKIAMIPMVFYLAQLLIDLAATRFADRIGYRTCVVVSQVLSAVGLVSMAFLPELVPVPFAGLLISVVLYAVGSGLIEVLVSPIVEACPFEHKDGMMSLLHSSYCWGAVGVVLGSTLFFALFGIEHWKVLTVLWALLSLYNTWNFLRCPIERLMEEGKGMSSGELLRLPLFWLIIVLMICTGASEATMAQWASAFTESALGVSKAVGDLAGPGLFAMFMGISRMLYGKFSERLHLTRVMLLCGVLCAGCYLLAALSASPVLGLAGCALCGLAVGIMWPGSISISSQKCPRGGTAMFAFLALAGDLGATVSPALVGSFAELAGGDLKAGLLVAAAFPVVLVIGLLILKGKAGGTALPTEATRPGKTSAS